MVAGRARGFEDLSLGALERARRRLGFVVLGLGFAILELGFMIAGPGFEDLLPSSTPPHAGPKVVDF